MNLIATEAEESKRYMLALIPDSGGLARLTRDNVARVEAMIANDSSYVTGSATAPPDSSTYWLQEIGRALVDRPAVSDQRYETAVACAVEAIDRENSTHLNADGVGRSELSERIYNMGRDRLLYCLRKPRESQFELVRLLSEKTHPAPPARGERQKRARANKSFATKFCHYACFVIFQGEAEQDNYPIFDSVVRKALPRYVAHYGLEPRSAESLEDYAAYCNCIDEVIENGEEPISRNGFDHLVWYYFKGRV